MNEIFDAWRESSYFKDAIPTSPEEAERQAREFFSAEGLAAGWLHKAVQQVVELVSQGANVEEAIRSVDEGLWNH